LGTITIHQRKNTDSKVIDIAHWKICKNVSLVVEYAILIRYQYHTARIRGLFESIDGPAARPPDNLSNSNSLGDFHQKVTQLTVPVY
jgi:hypothetical protein